MQPASPPDAPVRRRALLCDQSFIVQAPAGSGKTELLVRRYLSLLAIVQNPEEIVAVTFTRKAASEMRERALSALERSHSPEDDSELVALARAAAAHGAACGWDLLQAPQRMRITTIDGLCTSLVRQMPVLSGTGGVLAISDEPSALYLEAAQALVSRLESSPDLAPWIETVLRHLDNNVPRLEQLLAQMLARRDQWMRHLGSGREPPGRQVLEEAFRRLVEDTLAELVARFPQDQVDELFWLVRFAAAQLRDTTPGAALVRCGDLQSFPAPESGQLPVWLALCGFLFASSTRDWRRSVTSAHGFPPAASGGAGREAKARFRALIEGLEACEGLREAWLRVQGLPEPCYRDGQWAVLEALWHLLPESVADLWVVFQRRGEVDFTQVAWDALQALGSDEEPTDLALALDYRISHLLVDEFQDTSLSQYELLTRLTRGWSDGDGRTLFVVGDPMQSIYRFRQAEVGLFLKAWREGIGSVPLEPLQLAVNFRSQAGVVAWVNEAFREAFPRTQDIGQGAVTYVPAVAARDGLPGPVTVHAFIGDDGRAEADRVVELVRRALADPQAVTAILVRVRAHLFQIARALKEQQIPFHAVEMESLADTPVVRDLEALARAMLHPGDRVAWLSVLRAPWCGLLLEDLSQIAGADGGLPVWDLIHEPSVLPRLSADGRERLLRFRDVMAVALPARGRVPVRPWVEATWRDLAGPSCTAGDSDLLDAGTFLDLLEQMGEDGDVADFEKLAEGIRRLYAAPATGLPAERVQLMTLHKAKGLEFPVVILPSLGRRPRRSGKPLLLWAERTRLGDTAADLLLAPIPSMDGNPEPLASCLSEIDSGKGRLEEVRLLYVGATRAKDQLHLLGTVADAQEEGKLAPPAGTALSMIWPAVASHFVQAWHAGRGPRNPAPPAEDEIRLRRLPRDWRAPPVPAGLRLDASAGTAPGEPTRIEFEWARETIRQVGIAVHRVLHDLGRIGIERWQAVQGTRLDDELAHLFRDQGLPRRQWDMALPRAKEAIDRVLTDPRGHWILSQAHTEAHNEWAISGLRKGRVVRAVIDRSFVCEDVRWIIDYKISAHEGGDLNAFLREEEARYRGQLQRYAELVSGLDARPVRVGLYFPLLGAWREWVAD